MKALRAAMRRQRAALSPAELAATSLAITRHLWRLPPVARARRLAAYMAVGGEVDCSTFLAQARARGRETFLPVLHGQKLMFAPAPAGVAMAENRFGIPEPAYGAGCWLRGMDIDVVLVPLVAFDDQGHRLGMGGGYYDRSFSFAIHRGAWRRPWLIGLAHEFQRVDAISAQCWDVPLHAVVTERGARIF